MDMVTHLNLNKLQLRSATLHPLGSAPSTPATGQMYYDTALGAPRWYDGAAWINKATDSLLLGGSSLATVVARASHTGTQLAATISDLATTVKAYRLDEFAQPTADVNFGGRKITNVNTPSTSSDAATMGYVDAQVQAAQAGIDSKPSVRVASTGNLTLSGTQTIDGVAVSAGQRVLAKNQTTGSENGPYVVAAGAWTRAADGDATGELTPGAFWYVEEGTTNGGTQWRIANTGAITVGSTSITINQWSGGTSYTGSTSILLTGNVFSVIVEAGMGVVIGASGLKVDTAVVVRKFSVDIGDGSTNPITVTHNLGTKDVIVSVRKLSDDSVVLADVIAATTNTVTVGFGTAPTTNQYRVTVHA